MMFKKFKISAVTLAITFMLSCGGTFDQIVLGDVPYHKLAMNMFPRDTTFGTASQQMADVKSLGTNRIRVNLWFDTLYMPKSWSAPNFSRFDTVLNAAGTNGMDVVAILAYVPNWLKGRADWKNIYLNSYVRPVVTRYRNQIHNWEIWNEPDELTEGVLNGSPEDYFDLLRRTSNLVRSLDPGCTVISAATANITADGTAKIEWTNKLVDLGLRNYADVINIHYYSSRDVELPWVVNPLIEKSGMRVWVTEVGSKHHANQLDYFKDEMRHINKSISPEWIYWYTYAEGHLAHVGEIDPEDTWGLRTKWEGVTRNSPLYDHLKSR